jgi:hypothetical protein
MNKLIIAMTLVATAAAALPANAAPRADTKAGQTAAQSTIQVGNQCFKPTDSSRGFGYWDSCENVYAFSLGRRGGRGTIDVDRGSDGGGGDGGGGGGGGGR